MYTLIARLKSLPRWIVFQLGADYLPYSEESDVPGYAGSYSWHGHCLAFRRDDGRIQFAW